MMTRKTRFAIIGLLVFLGIFLLVWLWMFLRSRGETPEAEVFSPEPKADEIVENIPALSEQRREQEQQTRTQASGPTAVAKLFVERYGSYSNEAQFANLSDLLPVMTDDFAERTRMFLQEAVAPETPYGVTTRAVTVEVESLDETAGAAVVSLQTQREIAEGSTQNRRVEYQQIRLELRREAGIWKVHSAQWL